ncbi:cation:dicarboxylase symporter family transporter [Sphingomonas ginkgonis]|uniref:Cation:dicarboxylase symporter family transporter n=1 Tax=Sphingomonas ginkgonis TaxID=2315330 RepID=A0A3R9YM67_9SPHN|nr:cation:dicarboxylase symporter family transporter [Sphingomonas ginkgonis]RST30905.1 cation:dicarboxylase symporter family transporter [Sphingomonas ginkgonis]
MNDPAAPVAAPDRVKPARVRGSGAAAVLVGLGAGLAAGVAAQAIGGPVGTGVVAVAGTLGGLWLDALRMTIVPLLVSLVVTSVAGAGEQAEARLTARSLLLFLGLLAGSAVIGALVVPPLFAGMSAGPGAAAALAGAPPLAAPPVPAFGEWVRALVPTNIVQAAADDRIVALVLFSLLLGAAMIRIEERHRRPLLALFAGLREAMLALVGWILRLAPLGIAALALAAASGDLFAAAGITVRYIVSQILVSLLVILLCVALVALFRRALAERFVRALGGPLALAVGSRSSIACFPAMIVATERMRLERNASASVLSLAISLLKTSSPGAIVGTMAALAAFSGMHLGVGQVLIVAAMGALGTLTIAGLPGAVSFFAVMIPTAQVAGIPLTALPLLLAVEALGDMARTACNVAGDLAAAALLSPDAPAEEPA